MASGGHTPNVAVGHVTATYWDRIPVLGVGCIVLGAVALTWTVLFTAVSLFVLGLLLVGGGILALVGAFRAGSIAGTIMDLILGAMLVLTGVWLASQPLSALLAVTTLVASYLFLAAYIRVTCAVFDRGHGWGWKIAGGVVSILLAILIWIGWPVSGRYAIGLFIGLDLIVSGVIWIVGALAARHVDDLKDLSGRRTYEPTA